MLKQRLFLLRLRIPILFGIAKADWIRDASLILDIYEYYYLTLSRLSLTFAEARGVRDVLWFLAGQKLDDLIPDRAKLDKLFLKAESAKSILDGQTSKGGLNMTTIQASNLSIKTKYAAAKLKAGSVKAQLLKSGDADEPQRPMIVGDPEVWEQLGRPISFELI
jgi:hypothetical protein